MSPLRNAIHSSQNHQSSRQQAQFNNFATPNPPVRPHSTSRHHNSYDSPTEDIKRLLEDALEHNSVLTKEVERLKKENAGLRRLLEQNGLH